jgi:hypothetical protein
MAVITLNQEDIRRNQRFFVKGLYFAFITHSFTQEDIQRNQRFFVKGLYFTFITFAYKHILITLFITLTHIFSPTNLTHYLTTTPQSRLTNTLYFPYLTITYFIICQTTRTPLELLSS